MASFCTVWGREEKEILIFGYVHSNCNELDVPKDLIYLILKMYDEIIYWSFKAGEEMEYFLNFPNNQEIKGPKCEISKGIILQNTLSPNGFSVDQKGYTEYYLDCIEAPENDFVVTVYIIFSCKQTKYQHKVTKLFKCKEDWAVWAGICMPLKTIKNEYSLDFGCYPQLLHIEYFDQNKTLDIDKCWTSPIIIHKNCEFEWNISGNELNTIKNCKIGQHFYSHNFNNDAFCMYCSPKGWIPTNKNTFSFQVKLFKLPINIMSLVVNITMESDFMNHKSNDQIVFGYEKCRSGWPQDEKYRYDSTSFNQLSSIKMKCTIQIKSVCNKEDVVIDESQWSEYGIID